MYPGVTRRVARAIELLDRDIDVSFCPERIAEGHALEELQTLPQIVGEVAALAARVDGHLKKMETMPQHPPTLARAAAR